MRRAVLEELARLPHVPRSRVEAFGVNLRVDEDAHALLAPERDASLASTSDEVLLERLDEDLARAAAAKLGQDCGREREPSVRGTRTRSRALGEEEHSRERGGGRESARAQEGEGGEGARARG